jgi:hypothetical protein
MVSAGVRRIVRRNMTPAVSPFDATRFAPHDADDAQVVEEVDIPGGIVTPNGVFGPVERIG